MPVRKETVKQQFTDALPGVLEPGERALGGAFGISGPNPLFAQGLFGLAGYLIFRMRPYYVAVTDRRVIFMKTSFWTTRPKGIAWSDPRSAVTIIDVRTDAKLWNAVTFSTPSKQKLRMNFHAFWRAETKDLGELLSASPGGRPATPQPPPPPPP
jgi:hypothetical protein